MPESKNCAILSQTGTTQKKEWVLCQIKVEIALGSSLLE